jgi:outer membrane receptor protein involved in Fe transport
MQRSKKRKLRRAQAAQRGALASSLLVVAVPAYAQQAPGVNPLEEIVVTAQKRTESLQDVPISVQALGTEKLEQLNISNFADYARFLPSLSFQNGGQNGGPGFSRPYMRGVASGGDGNHSGSQPSVGTYLDEQPVTMINGALDVHLYDIQRVEVLAGPQGTLYGASSQAGTIRIITNKPDPSGFAAGYDLQASTLSKGGNGYLAEGFVNLPVSDNTAIRLVGWHSKDAGYIDNAPGSVTYPTSGITKTNAALVEKDYNDGTTTGGRAALRIDLDDSWTVSAGIMGQEQEINGSFGYRPDADLELSRYNPERARDRWMQAALTVEGRFSNFDVVYAGSYLNRKDSYELDYVDYSYYYDACCGYGSYVYDDAGSYIDPTQYIQARDKYDKQSHELRISSSGDGRLQYVAGLFFQRQEHDIEQRYVIDGLAGPDTVIDPPGSLWVTGWPDTWWLTKQLRIDRDYAAFGELTYAITDKLSATGGVRFFRAKNSLEGFFGFGLTNPFFPVLGEPQCFVYTEPGYVDNPIKGAPCTNLDKEVKETGNTPKLNLTYRFDEDRMVYATYSEGFRPGGVNRRGTLPPYKADFLKNYEIGWKTSWAGNTLRFNGAAFVQDWKDFQFSFLGQNALTQIANAGSARIKGVEADLAWAATDHLTLSAAFALLDAKLAQPYCGELDENGNDLRPCPQDPLAPNGQRLPVTPRFKGNVTARYVFEVGGYDAHVQAAVGYVGSRWPDLRTYQREILGQSEAYTIADFSAGVARNGYSAELFINNAFDERAQLDRWAQCDAAICGISGTYITPNLPRMIGLRFGQRF